MQQRIRVAALCTVVALAACEQPPEPLAPDPQASIQQALQLPGQKIGPGVLEALQRGESPRIMIALAGGTP
ncbi:MAG: hypothetical protein ACREM1_21450, partial [Longimicrobiales bacterium]